jgi:hypothetical protein
MLAEILLQRFERYFIKVADQPYKFSILKCFEDLGPQFQPKEREDLASLSQCIIYLLPFWTEGHLIELFVSFVEQLTTVNSFIDMTKLNSANESVTTERGKGKHF